MNAKSPRPEYHTDDGQIERDINAACHRLSFGQTLNEVIVDLVESGGLTLERATLAAVAASIREAR